MRTPNVAIESAYSDNELHDWLVWAEANGTNFLQAIAEAAFVSDLKLYALLRPTLVKLREMYPEERVGSDS